MHKAVSFLIHAIGGATVTVTMIAALAWVTYAEKHQQTANALSYFDKSRSSSNPEKSWADQSPRQVTSPPSPTNEECQLPPNRFGEPFIRCS